MKDKPVVDGWAAFQRGCIAAIIALTGFGITLQLTAIIELLTKIAGG